MLVIVAISSVTVLIVATRADMQSLDTNRLPEPAPMCRRIGANLVEIILFAIATYGGYLFLSVLFGYAMPLPFREGGPPDWFSATVLISLWVFFVVVIETLMISISGATLGKKLFNIRVVADRPDKRVISTKRALGRALFKAAIWHPAMIYGWIVATVVPLWLKQSSGLPPWLPGFMFFSLALVVGGVLAVGTVGMFRRRRKGVHDIIFRTVVTKSRD